MVFAKLRDEEAPETPVEGRATQDSLEVGKGVPPFLLRPHPWHGTCHNHVLWALLVGHLPQFPLHLWPLRQDWGEVIQSHDVAQIRLPLLLCSGAPKLTPLASCSMTPETFIC